MGRNASYWEDQQASYRTQHSARSNHGGNGYQPNRSDQRRNGRSYHQRAQQPSFPRTNLNPKTLAERTVEVSGGRRTLGVAVHENDRGRILRIVETSRDRKSSVVIPYEEIGAVMQAIEQVVAEASPNDNVD